MYLCRENGDLICLDAETGNQLYRERTHRHRHRASPIYANGYVYLTAREALSMLSRRDVNLRSLPATRWERSSPPRPSSQTGPLYLRSYQALYAIVLQSRYSESIAYSLPSLFFSGISVKSLLNTFLRHRDNSFQNRDKFLKGYPFLHCVVFLKRACPSGSS